jgi:hypothetical protein
MSSGVLAIQHSGEVIPVEKRDAQGNKYIHMDMMKQRFANEKLSLDPLVNYNLRTIRYQPIRRYVDFQKVKTIKSVCDVDATNIYKVTTNIAGSEVSSVSAEFKVLKNKEIMVYAESSKGCVEVPLRLFRHNDDNRYYRGTLPQISNLFVVVT